MNFGSNLLWNRFYGCYIKEGLTIQGDITVDSDYKLITDTINGNSGNITSDSIISCKRSRN